MFLHYAINCFCRDFFACFLTQISAKNIKSPPISRLSTNSVVFYALLKQATFCFRNLDNGIRKKIFYRV